MESRDVANKFAYACNTCKGNRCPYSSQCTGKSETCKMKEVAMMIRSKDCEIDTLSAAIKGYDSVLMSLMEYIKSLEDINQRYHNLTVAFQQSYRPSNKTYRGRKGPVRVRQKKKLTQEDLIRMDGDERYADEAPIKPPPQKPMVII